MRIPACFAALLLAGCGLLTTDPEERVLRGSEGSGLTVLHVAERVENFADRYVQLMADACDDLQKAAETAEARNEALLLKLRTATSAYDIVTSSHPLQEMLDLLVQVELQWIVWVREGKGGRLFGSEAETRLAPALEAARREILALARQVMKNDKIEDVLDLVNGWRSRHPEVERTAFIRFGPFLEAPGGDIVSQIFASFGSLNPLDPTARSVERVTRSADDMFFFVKRMPMLLEWQLEAAAAGATASVVAALTRSEETLVQGTSLLREAGEAARATEGAFRALEKITNPEKDPEEKKEEALANGEKKPPKRPFDITEYTEAGRQAAQTADEARRMFEALQGTVHSPALDRRIKELSRRAESVIETAFGYLILLVAVFFALLAGYRLYLAWLRRRLPPASPPPAPPPPA